MLRPNMIENVIKIWIWNWNLGKSFEFLSFINIALSVGTYWTSFKTYQRRHFQQSSKIMLNLNITVIHNERSMGHILGKYVNYFSVLDIPLL